MGEVGAERIARCAAPNVDQTFIDCLADIVATHLKSRDCEASDVDDLPDVHRADLQADKDVVGQGHRVPGPTAGKEKSCSVTMIILHHEVVIRNYLENNFVKFYHEMPIICP